ncbi:MAG: ATP-binding protein [Ahrensia sp.]|nr:ATP-binding protein [Ahrensia sp.]
MAAPFPFSAIVGQEEMKQALLMTATDPNLSGVLVFGELVNGGNHIDTRGLPLCLKDLQGPAEGSGRYNCEPGAALDICPVCHGNQTDNIVMRPMPVVDLPLGATEDRVCGALDLEKALVSGQKAFEPGLLAKAHRGFLYIDEVNLLEDHLVDLLLDVAQSGVNVVERDGLSIRHPARFVLVGSGNPEEGELRPQLLDRFGLSVDVTSPKDLKMRVEVVKRREAYERDPIAFHQIWKKSDEAIRTKIQNARARLPNVEVPDDILELASLICLRMGIDGLRGELTLMRAARAVTALDGRTIVTENDVMHIAPAALRHRLRRDPLDDSGSSARVERALDDIRTELAAMQNVESSIVAVG